MTDNRDSLAAHQAAGLRQLADAIEAHPELANQLSFPLGHGGLMANNRSTDVKTEVAHFVRTMKAFTGKPVDVRTHDGYKLYVAHFGPIEVQFFAYRSQVCEKVVVGTREVIEEVPDPEALAAVPTVKVTRTEPVTEWRCSPILAADTETAVA